MIIQVKKKAEELKLKSADLITRTVGRDMYARISEAVAVATRDEVVVLDFSGIKVIDTSFIDELLVKLISDSKSEEKGFYIKIKNISRTAEINIDLVFKSYSHYKDNRLAVITEDICQNNSFFIGPLTDREREVIDFIRVNRMITNDDLETSTGLDREAARQLIDTLCTMKLIRKEKGGILMAI